jgi:AcrR family transcriptional regulator
MGRLPESMDQEKGRALLDAATAMLGEHGCDVSMAEIAHRSGVSRQTLFDYFLNKEALRQALLEMKKSSGQCPCCPASSEESAVEGLASYARAVLTWVDEPRRAVALRALVRGLGVSREEARRLGAATRGQAILSLAAYFDLESRRGRLDVDNPQDAAEMFLNLLMAGPQLRIVQGVDTRMTADEIDRLSRRCAEVFAIVYAPSSEQSTRANY